jgi:hypothetical protein
MELTIVIRWVAVIIGGAFAMATVQCYWPSVWPEWLGYGVGVGAMTVTGLGLPLPRPHGWRLVAAIVSSFAAAAAAAYILSPLLIR